MHNNRGMESCIRAKQPICLAQWERRCCGLDLITRGCLWQRPARGKERREDTLSGKRSASKLHLADLHDERKIHRREIDRPRQLLNRFGLAGLEFRKMIFTWLSKFICLTLCTNVFESDSDKLSNIGGTNFANFISRYHAQRNY